MPWSGHVEFRIASTGVWVRWSERIPLDEDGIRVYGLGKHPSGYVEVLYADIPGNSWNVNRLNKFIQRANQAFEVRIPLTDPSLVDDEHGPGGTDPNREDFHWDAGDLVAIPARIYLIDYNADFPNVAFRRVPRTPRT
jgi:hypothetical protein